MIRCRVLQLAPAAFLVTCASAWAESYVSHCSGQVQVTNESGSYEEVSRADVGLSPDDPSHNKITYYGIINTSEPGTFKFKYPYKVLADGTVRAGQWSPNFGIAWEILLKKAEGAQLTYSVRHHGFIYDPQFGTGADYYNITGTYACDLPLPVGG
jgi:hypothetical protein